ncbi:DUF3775 domain-containing protein [Methylocystis sp. IM3]|uniref:DUF3775 domain-containing protein n=1 Tax=unclassified Methylocystis TaxID=2625913 RepID=UPI0030FAB99C
MIKLEELEVRQAQFIAILAKAARQQRDELLGNVAEEDLGGVREHNPTAALGLEPLSPDAPQISALRDAIASLSAAARCELYALMRIGQGHFGAKELRQGASEAYRIGDEAASNAMIEDADLHDHITKALYEADLSA